MSQESSPDNRAQYSMAASSSGFRDDDGSQTSPFWSSEPIYWNSAQGAGGPPNTKLDKGKVALVSVVCCVAAILAVILLYLFIRHRRRKRAPSRRRDRERRKSRRHTRPLTSRMSIPISIYQDKEKAVDESVSSFGSTGPSTPSPEFVRGHRPSGTTPTSTISISAMLLAKDAPSAPPSTHSRTASIKMLTRSISRLQSPPFQSTPLSQPAPNYTRSASIHSQATFSSMSEFDIPPLSLPLPTCSPPLRPPRPEGPSEFMPNVMLPDLDKCNGYCDDMGSDDFHSAMTHSRSFSTAHSHSYCHSISHGSISHSPSTSPLTERSLSLASHPFSRSQGSPSYILSSSVSSFSTGWPSMDFLPTGPSSPTSEHITLGSPSPIPSSPLRPPPRPKPNLPRV